MAKADEDLPRKTIGHEIGQDLSLLSAAECEERIAVLRAEIVRIEAALAKKQTSRNAAERFFR